MKINDECHHLTSMNIIEEENKTYINMLKISCIKMLSLTATIKEIENYSDNGVVSNDNIEYFGNIIDRRCLLWAINKNIVCDYVIQTILNNQDKLEEELLKLNIYEENDKRLFLNNFESLKINYEENDKRLFLSSFVSLKSIFEGHSHHLLIYSNSNNSSLKLIKFIKKLLDNNYFVLPDLYYSNYDSTMNLKDQKEILNNFEKSKFGIISCVYCLGEGYDNHNIDGVVFSENMSSNIRIVQSSLRASRKNRFEPNKITKIILPILNKDDWLENNDNLDLRKIREIIYQMGLEDETINQKIKIFNIEIKKNIDDSNKKRNIDNFNYLTNCENELIDKLILKSIKRSNFGINYEKARKIIASNNIKSKKSYYELCEIDNRLCKEPELLFKEQFTNWIDYLSIERIYYDLETCKNKVYEYLLLYHEIKNCLDLYELSDKLCKIDNLFPPSGLWTEYYNVKNLADIITFTNQKKKIINLNI
jgi:predicted helicase